MNERRLSADPRWTKSKTESDDPRRVSPYALIELPTRTNDRKENDDPSMKKSRTLNVDPSRETP
jgi:hypothetical protein